MAGYPDGWELKTLGDCVIGKLSYGINASAVSYDIRKPKYIRITDITSEGKYDESDKKSVNTSECERYKLREGDIVIARTGATVGKSYLYDKQDGNLVYAGYLIKASINCELYNPYFIWGQLRTSRFWQWVAINAKGTAQPGINSKEYASFSFPVAPRKEQDAIAEVLEAFDEHINDLAALIERKKKIRDEFIRVLVSGKMRMPGFSGAWGSKQLRDIATCRDGDWIESKDQHFKGIRLIQTGNIGITRFLNKPKKSRWITEDTFTRLRCHEVKPGDILISRMAAPVGRACIVPDLGTRMIASVDCVIVNCGSEIDKNFLLYYLSSPKYFKEAKKFSAGTTRLRISLTNLVKFFIPLPPMDEQKAIGNFLATLDDEINALETKRERISKLRDAAINSLLTGKIRLKIPS